MEGRSEGKREGRTEGRAEGISKGKNEGIALMQKAHSLLKSGQSAAQVAKATGLPESVIETLC